MIEPEIRKLFNAYYSGGGHYKDGKTYFANEEYRYLAAWLGAEERIVVATRGLHYVLLPTLLFIEVKAVNLYTV